MSNLHHFIGIKGSGMSSLALISKSLGYDVQGSDVDNYIFTQKALIEAGIPVLSFSQDNIKDNMTIIIGNSFDERNIEVQAIASNKTLTVYRYYEFLAKIMKEHISISVAGSHGKTTTTGMLTKLLSAMKATGYLIGDGTGQLKEDSDYFVVESCEYKGTVLNYSPEYGIIKNIDLGYFD